MARESFLVYGSWEEPIMQLSNESKGMLLVALLKYHNTGKIIELPPDARMAFLFMKKQMDLDAAKYDKTCAARAAAGRIGGLQSKSKQKKQMIKSPGKSKQLQANQADNENENEKENDDDVVAQQPGVQHINTTSKKKITQELVDKYRAELSGKFYIPGRTDAICRAALIHFQKMPMSAVVAVANGESLDIDWKTGKSKWEFDRELDIAAALRTWKQRIVDNWDLGKYQDGDKSE